MKLVILSGGMDSALCLAMARADGDSVLAVSFDYGQRHLRELDSARRLAAHYDAEFMRVALDARAWGGSALTDDIEVPRGSGIEGPEGSGIEGPGLEGADIPATYVPARNIIFLSIALSIAEARGAGSIWIGVNAVDYSGYPDCRPEFMNAFREVARVGQKCGVEGRPIAIETPLIALSKAEVVAESLRLDVPLELTWSCYAGGERPCGECDSCRLRALGFQRAGSDDPALAAKSGAAKSVTAKSGAAQSETTTSGTATSGL